MLVINYTERESKNGNVNKQTIHTHTIHTYGEQKFIDDEFYLK